MNEGPVLIVPSTSTRLEINYGKKSNLSNGVQPKWCLFMSANRMSAVGRQFATTFPLVSPLLYGQQSLAVIRNYVHD